MRRERLLLYAVVFVIAVHVLVMTKTDTIINTGRRYLPDTSILIKAFQAKPKAEKKSSKNVKTIVWYDVSNNGHGLRNKAKQVNFNLCKVKDCVRLPNHIAKNKSSAALEDEPVDADAVLFQGAHLARLQPPRRKSPDQVFVFAERESWMFYGVDTSFENYKYAKTFNWTMTYRMDSDIPMPYGEIRSLASQKMVQKNSGKPTQTKGGKNYKKIFSEKIRDVVWLVSNCASKSLREDYIEEMQKHIAVDIIGNCGNATCPKRKSKNCTAHIEKDYKFILSFENTFHKDYVTEKLFDWFNKDIIQVVYGLANYSTVVPRGTVVNTAKFESPEALAQYLKTLGADRHRYLNYLRRKDEFVSVGHEIMQQKAYCRLCEMLHNKDKHQKVYEHVGTWWKLNNTQGINPFVSDKVVKVGELIKQAHNSTDKFVQILKNKKLV